MDGTPEEELEVEPPLEEDGEEEEEEVLFNFMEKAEMRITLRKCKNEKLSGQVFFEDHRAIESKGGNRRRRKIFIF